MTKDKLALEEVSELWRKVRSADFISEAESIIKLSAPNDVSLTDISHVRTAHYAAFKIVDSENRTWLVRIGASNLADDQRLTDNSAYLGTSAFAPTGQCREHLISQFFENVHADVIASTRYTRVGALDVTWAPFVNGSNDPVNATQWHKSLSSLYAYSPSVEFPVFTNRIKTLERLFELDDKRLAQDLQEQYDSQLKKMFKISSKWSVVHGDAHAGNVLLVEDKALLFDFDTVCWAPSVWDLTHLLNRAGDKDNFGYTAKELVSHFNFNSEEVEAAMALRYTARTIAKIHRDQSNIV